MKLEDGRTVQFVKDLPPLVAFASATVKKGVLGKKIKLRAQPVAEYKNFRITKMWIFPGKPEKGKAPPTAEEASPLPDQEEIWEGEVTLPNDPAKKGAEISLVAEGNFPGGPTMTSVDKVMIALTPPKPPGPPVGTIIGKVTQGQLAQPGEEVTLYKVPETGAEVKVGTAKTDKNGEYIFKDLAPGNYRVTSFKKQLRALTGRSEIIKVEAEKTATADLALKL